MENVKKRQLVRKVTGIESSDGDGVKLTRIIGSRELPLLDPFLMLDAFKSDQATDYIGGFPSHPHRGFETVTYLLAGRLRHKDSEGHEGVIEPGGVQWMTAGSGIVHSEMPEQQDGLLHGYQLWLNLPAKDKFTPPDYQELSVDELAFDTTKQGVTIRVIAGKTDADITGAVQAHFVKPRLFDVSLEQGKQFNLTLDQEDNAFIYVVEGELAFTSTSVLKKNELGIIADGNTIEVTANRESRFLLASARPLNEPIARGGPFVMTTQQQLQQAFIDFAR